MSLRVLFFTVVLAGSLAAGACSAGREPEGPTTPGGTKPGGGSSQQPRENPPPPPPNQSSPAERNPPPPRPPAPPDTGSCDASKAQWAVGERASDSLMERARVAAGAASARFVRPDQPITLEYLGSRLTLGLDRNEFVRTVVCG